MSTSQTLGVAAFCALLLLAGPSVAEDEKPTYSPHVHDHPVRAFFGDTHVHTSYSADAGFVGCTLGPDEAYRFAKGEEVTSSTGVRARLGRALDFVVISDHAENLGLSPMLIRKDPTVLATEFGRKAQELMAAGKGPEVFDMWRLARASGKDPMEGDRDVMSAAWKDIIDAAERHNAPGAFTAFVGYEWTSVPDGRNLHRNVVFRDGRERVSQVLPFGSYDSEDVEDLWAWMAAYEEKTKGRVLAIPHNGNLSNGLMFDDVRFGSETPIDRDYADRRRRWEPLYETTQMKGDGEAHPLLSPDDEFADFETWDRSGINSIVPKTPDMLPREYSRAALLRGMAYEATLGSNPFKFGLVGSTDTHTALSTPEESNYFGKVTPLEPAPSEERFHEPVAGRRPSEDGKDLKIEAWKVSPGGLAGVWARSNTRASLWDAMARREVFATTGTRMTVRMFGGWGYTAGDLHRSDFVKHAYAKGVPMGGDLTPTTDGAHPGFLIQAMRDPDGANLDRVQVIKGWVDAEGKTRERVFDVALSDGRKPGADGRCRKPVGNTVNVEAASYTNSIGAVFLETYWRDPTFDPKQRAFYYVRVLEIPTPRWTTYDAKIFKRKIPDGAPTAIQERAYTSPIWYTP